jgi:phage terminase small subunit
MSAKKAKAKLNPKQKRFVSEYVIDYNGTQAAIRAGYSLKTANEQASQLLAKLSIQDAVDKATEEKRKRNILTADYVISRLQENAERCMTKGSKDYDPANANRALELLGKNLKLFVDKIDHTSSDQSMSPKLEIEVIVPNEN